MVPRTVNAAAHHCFAGFLGVWCYAFRAHIVYMSPRAMPPRARKIVSSSLRGAAHSMVSRTCMLPRTSVAAHSSFGRAFVYLPRILVCDRAVLCVAAQLYMLPRSSMCCRAPMVPRAAERFVVLACVAAQLYMPPRSSMCCRAPMVPRAAERFVSSPMLQRSGLDCYKRAVSSTVVVSRSTAVVEVGRRRIVVESVVWQPSWRLVVVG